MRKILFASLLPIIALADCASLMAKYEAPEPESKTMKQVERWINKKLAIQLMLLF